MSINDSKQKLMDLQSRLSAYNHAAGLIYYDGNTSAPKKSAENRAHALAILSGEIYKLSTGEDTIKLLEELDNYVSENESTPSDDVIPFIKLKRMVYLMLKDIRNMQKIPMNEYIAFQELLSTSDAVWHTAKDTSDFLLFLPYLEKVFSTLKKFAQYIDPDKAAYDHWLNEFEPGITMASLDVFFDTLKKRLVPLIREISTKEQPDDSFMYGHFPEYKQDELSKYLMKLIGIDMDHCVLSTTEHPFTTSLGSHFDERITTNYKKDNFISSLFSVVHEGGHAMYDMGSADDLAYTVLDCGVSMGIHESQSRFYENIIGRSRSFTSYILPKLKSLFPENMSNVSENDFYRAVNISHPSLIRTEADEVTYCLHVMIRYELEKQVLSGNIQVKDLPGEWNRMYKEYLGVDVPDDRRGVLQDSHWSSGLIGYFPSYALGSAYGAQFLSKMKETVDVEKCISSGDFSEINNWNREHIWKHGSLYAPSEILDMTLGAPFDPDHYMSYLENKYKDIYNI